eukprot:Lankesteria_metandrocarpae@DN5446_c0_g1_i13.p1
MAERASKRQQSRRASIIPRLPPVAMSSMRLRSHNESPHQGSALASFGSGSPRGSVEELSSLQSQRSLLGLVKGEAAVEAFHDPLAKTLKGRIIAPYVQHNFAATYEGLKMYGPIFKFRDHNVEREYRIHNNDLFPRVLFDNGLLGGLTVICTSLALLLGMYLYLDTIYPVYYCAVGAIEIANIFCVITFFTMSNITWPSLKNNTEIIAFISQTLFVAVVYTASIVILTSKEILSAPGNDRQAMIGCAVLVSYTFYLLPTGSSATMFPFRMKILVFFLAFAAMGFTTVTIIFGHVIRLFEGYAHAAGIELMTYLTIWGWASMFFGCRCMSELKERIDFLQYSLARKKVLKLAKDLNAKAHKAKGGTTGVEEIIEWLNKAIHLVKLVESEISPPELLEAIKLMEETAVKLTNTDRLFTVNVDHLSVADRDSVKNVMAAFNNVTARPLETPAATPRGGSRISPGSMSPFIRTAAARKATVRTPRMVLSPNDDSASDYSQIPNCVLGNELNTIVGRQWNLNLLPLCEGNPNIILEVGTAIITQDIHCYGVKKEVFQRLFYEIQKRYFANPYHNATHGATVAHTSMSLCRMLKVDKALSYDPLAELTLLVSALGHDIGHPGQNNAFFVNVVHPIAFLYNNTSVLENFHCALIFRLLSEPESNVFEEICFDDFHIVRMRIIELVLATDMKQHFESQTKFRVRRASPEFDFSKNVEDMWLVLKMCLKAADLSHGALEWSQHVEWSMRVTEEFYKQGDSEFSMGLPKSPLCDRDTHKGLAKSQKGFLDFVVHPLYVELDAAANGALQSTCLIRLVENKSRWDERAVLEVVTPIPEAITALSTSTPNVKKLIKELTGAVTYQQSLPAKRSAEEKLTCVKETQTDISDESEGDVELQKGLGDALCKVDSE